jgi:hypothetical protein
MPARRRSLSQCCAGRPLIGAKAVRFSAVTGERTAARVGPPRPTVRALELDGDISLYDSATSQALLLNATASDVWRLLDGEHNTDDIVRLLASAYSVQAGTIRPDVERTIAELVAAGMLEA